MTRVPDFRLSFGVVAMAFYYSSVNSPRIRLLGMFMLILVTLFTIEAV
jgi:hypothetical protein